MSAEMTYVLQDVRKGRALTPLPACILRRPHCTLPSSGSRGRKLILSCSRLQFSFPMCCFHLPFGSSFLPVLFCPTQHGAHFSCSLSLLLSSTSQISHETFEYAVESTADLSYIPSSSTFWLPN